MWSERTNPLIIPELDDISVKSGVIPWSFRVEDQTLSPATLFLEQRERFPSLQKLYTKTKSRQIGQFLENKKKAEKQKCNPKYFDGHQRSYNFLEKG